MNKNKTQQFSKFFLKDLKTKSPKYGDDKFGFEKFSISLYT